MMLFDECSPDIADIYRTAGFGTLALVMFAWLSIGAGASFPITIINLFACLATWLASIGIASHVERLVPFCIGVVAAIELQWFLWSPTRDSLINKLGDAAPGTFMSALHSLLSSPAFEWGMFIAIGAVGLKALCRRHG